MAPISIADRLKIIKGISIALPKDQGVVFANEEQSATVAAGSSICFVGNLSAQMKSDVLKSTLFAQIVANKQHDRQEQATQWYDYYKYMLETVGWNSQSFDFAYLSDANSYLTVDNLVLKLAAPSLTGGELALFTTMIDALKQAKNDAASKLFDSSSKSSNKANFQLGVASNAQGNVMLKLGAYYYGAQQDIDKVLFFTFGSQKVKFYAGNQTMLLDEEVYSQVRKAVSLFLDQHATATVLIRDIEL